MTLQTHSAVYQSRVKLSPSPGVSLLYVSSLHTSVFLLAIQIQTDLTNRSHVILPESFILFGLNSVYNYKFCYHRVECKNQVNVNCVICPFATLQTSSLKAALTWGMPFCATQLQHPPLKWPSPAFICSAFLISCALPFKNLQMSSEKWSSEKGQKPVNSVLRLAVADLAVWGAPCKQYNNLFFLKG